MATSVPGGSGVAAGVGDSATPGDVVGGNAVAPLAGIGVPQPVDATTSSVVAT
jgi:hypothetical protein